ncbi:hypothetical protein HYE32_00945 [Mycoplasmopsis bovis]|nr:hypothetical protein [Mycoplasmopsis bovis]QQH22213.1 hypothetical protein HYE32_00945 [Mycoplasmopsis bovis]
MLLFKYKGSVLLEAMKHGAFQNCSQAASCSTYSHNVSAKLISYKETKDDKFIYELDENKRND